MTEKEINALKPKDKRYKIYLGNCLVLEVMTSGTKIFRLKIKNNYITLGKHPDISLKEARILTESVIEEQNRKPVVRFGQVAWEWVERQSWSATHTSDVIQKLKAYILPYFENCDIKTLTRLEIISAFRSLEESGKYETCKKAIGIVKLIYSYAIICGYCEGNPALELSKIIKSSPAKPMAALTEPEDIARLMTAIHNYHGYDITKLLLLWSAYTFCRPGECRGALWSEIKEDVWIIPAQRMKMRTEHIVPLSRQCLEILEQVKQYQANDFIFPSVRVARPLSNATVLVALRIMGFTKEEMTAHGFRAMASTVLNNKGYRSDLIEKGLAHSDKDKIRSVYNRAIYLEERREMMQWYSDYLDNLIK